MDTSELQGSPVPENRASSDTKSRLEKGAYTGWQLFFLLRLESLVRLEEEYTVRTDEDEDREMRIKLLHKAVYSTYRDCIDLGVGSAAKRMFKVKKRPTGPNALKNS